MTSPSITEKQGLTISVNISAKDFYCIDVVGALTELVDKYAVDSHRLRLEIRDSERTRIILKSVISLAGSLGMDVIAEGVETKEQFRVLAEL